MCSISQITELLGHSLYFKYNYVEFSASVLLTVIVLLLSLLLVRFSCRIKQNTNLDNSYQSGEDNEQYNCVSRTESVGKIIVVLRPSLGCLRHYFNELVHLKLVLHAVGSAFSSSSSSCCCCCSTCYNHNHNNDSYNCWDSRSCCIVWNPGTAC